MTTSNTPEGGKPSPAPTTEDAPSVPIDPKMLGVLVCPKTRGPLVYDAKNNELISKKAGLAYPIRDGVPILQIEEARPL